MYLCPLSLTVSVGATLQKLSSLDGDTVYLDPLPSSQLPLLVSSYNETIAQLEAEDNTLMTACAMHELGNLHFHNSNTKSVNCSYSAM